MKRKTIVLLACFAIGIVGIGNAIAAGTGPAPNSGDCIPDGSGFEKVNEPHGEGYGPGPAPNAGDGIPDGPGWK
jgi:hypothetical protein